MANVEEGNLEGELTDVNLSIAKLRKEMGMEAQAVSPAMNERLEMLDFAQREMYEFERLWKSSEWSGKKVSNGKSKKAKKPKRSSSQVGVGLFGDSDSEEEDGGSPGTAAFSVAADLEYLRVTANTERQAEQEEKMRESEEEETPEETKISKSVLEFIINHEVDVVSMKHEKQRVHSVENSPDKPPAAAAAGLELSLGQVAAAGKKDQQQPPLDASGVVTSLSPRQLTVIESPRNRSELKRGNTALLEEHPFYRLELGCADLPQVDPRELIIQDDNAMVSKGYYKKWFLGREHDNFVGTVPEVGTVVLSAIEGEEDGKKVIRALIRTAYGEQFKVIDQSLLSKKLNPKDEGAFLRAVSPMFQRRGSERRFSRRSDNVMRKVNEIALVEKLAQTEAMQLVQQLKVGVLLCTQGQSEEEQMFQNQQADGSEDYNEFLQFLGTRIELEGWDRFAGGLDTKYGNTGKESIFREFNSMEIMFHVSTLLPYTARDAQQVEKKRHLGNDIVLVVFSESGEAFDPSTVTSQFIHVVIVVSVDRPLTAERGQTMYRVGVACKQGVPVFAPQLPSDPTFPADDSFRQFLFTKMINAELATYRAPSFLKAMKRTRTRYLQSFAEFQ